MKPTTPNFPNQFNTWEVGNAYAGFEAGGWTIAPWHHSWVSQMVVSSKTLCPVIVTASKIIFWGRGFIATVQHSLPSAIIMLKSSQSGILNPKGLHTYVAEESVSAEMSSFHEVVAGKRCAEGQ